MKRIVKITAILIVLVLFVAACSQQVCPAYSHDDVKKEPSQETRS